MPQPSCVNSHSGVGLAFQPSLNAVGQQVSEYWTGDHRAHLRSLCVGYWSERDMSLLRSDYIEGVCVPVSKVEARVQCVDCNGRGEIRGGDRRTAQ